MTITQISAHIRSSHSGLRALAKLVLFGKRVTFTKEESEIVDGNKSVVVERIHNYSKNSFGSFGNGNRNRKSFSPTVHKVLDMKKNLVNLQLKKLTSKYTTPQILSKFSPGSNLMLTHE